MKMFGIINKPLVKPNPKSSFRFRESTHYRRRPISNHQSVVTRTASFMSDVSLYQMSPNDIFWSSATRNLVLHHLPMLFVYRQMRLPLDKSAHLVLLSSYLKTVIQLALLLYV